LRKAGYQEDPLSVSDPIKRDLFRFACHIEWPRSMPAALGGSGNRAETDVRAHGTGDANPELEEISPLHLVLPRDACLRGRFFAGPANHGYTSLVVLAGAVRVSDEIFR
jgi:hypothetical protein